MPSRRVILVIVVATVIVIVATAWYWHRAQNIDAKLHDPNPAVRLAAIRSLDRDSDVELLVNALRDEDADVRLVTAWQLGGERRYAEKRVAALIEAFKDPHGGVRRAAAESLWSLGPASGPALIAALKDSDPHVRAGAAFALRTWHHKEKRKRAPGEEAAIRPLLKDLLHDEDAEVRANAEKALP